MAILANEKTRIIIQGITGREATIFAKDSVDYGAKIVAGVVPGKGGWNVHGIHTWACPWTDIGNNSIQHSEEYGIWLDAGSWGASVYLNTLDNNTISNAKDDSSVGSNGEAPPEEVAA